MKPELFNTLNGYSKKDLFSDLSSGLLVAIIALPLSIAMGIQSSATLQAGLITAIIGGFFIAFFGGSNFSIGGPSATFLVVTVGYIATEGIGFLGMQFITFMAGILIIIAGLCKCGKLMKYVPFPIITGFTSGIGVILLIGQVKDFFGLTLKNGNPADIIPKLIEYGKNITSFNFVSFCVGVFTLLLIYFLPKLSKKIPAVFAAVIISTFLSLLLETIFKDKINIATIGSVYGNVKAEFNFLDFLNLGSLSFKKLIVPAFVIALLSSLEGLMSATVAESMTNQKHDPNMELVGHGLGNMGSALFGGLPVTGALARTSANIGGGAKSPLSGIFHSIILLIMYLVLMPVMKYIPFTVLAAVLIKVSITMSRFPLFAKFVTFGIRDSIILLSTFLLTIFLGVVYGVLIGLSLSFIVNFKSFTHKLTIEDIDFEDVLNPLLLHTKDIKALKVSGAVYFISINKLIARIKDALNNVDELMIDMSSLYTIDATSVERLAKLTKSLSKKGKRLIVHNLSQKAFERYEKAFEYIIVKW